MTRAFGQFGGAVVAAAQTCQHADIIAVRILSLCLGFRSLEQTPGFVACQHLVAQLAESRQLLGPSIRGPGGHIRLLVPAQHARRLLDMCQLRQTGLQGL